MKILYLYTEVMGYTLATITALVEAGAEIHLVHWNERKKTPYKMRNLKNVYTYPRTGQTKESIKQLADKINPNITVVSGWQDKDYLAVARRLRKQDTIVVCGLDGQWNGSLRQFVAAGLGHAGFFLTYFSHAWVAGVYQYEYARKLGFDKKEIIFDLYSADFSQFSVARGHGVEIRRKKYPRRFLFVGRFEPIKGIDTLLKTWELLGEERANWELHLVGNGSLKEKLAQTPGIVVKDFMQPDQLINEIAGAGCFVLPSWKEPWGVVVHEATIASLPLLVSDVVGARATFLVDGLNGYCFKARDAQDLAEKMRQIIQMDDNRLYEMGEESHKLSQRITPQTSASNLLSLACGRENLKKC